MNGDFEVEQSDINSNNIEELEKRITNLEKIADLTEKRMIKITEILAEITGIDKK